MPDQINERAVQLTAAAPVQLDHFTLPEGTYPGVARSADGGSGEASGPRYFMVLTASDLAENGEPVRPDAANQELDVTDLIKLGLLTVE